MPYRPTEAQRRAIECRDKTLLVSAAAGAGKTSTLTARVIASLLDDKHPADLSRMLIVTFTKAAAADLREHVRHALADAVEAHPDDRRLAEQLALLPAAQISTVDSFFLAVLRRNAAAAGFSPETRVADEAETLLLRLDTAKGLLEECYADGIPGVCDGDGFCRLADALTDVKNEQEGLCDALLDFSGACDAFPEAEGYPLALAERMKAEADLPMAESLWGRAILDRIAAFCDYALNVYEPFSLAAADEEEDNREEVDRVREIERTLYLSLKKYAACGDVEKLLAALSVKSARLNPPVKDLPALTAFTDVRKKLAQKRNEIKEWFVSPEDWRATLHATADTVALFCRVAGEFRRRCDEEKRRRGVCEFSDLLRTLYRFLIDENGRPTEAAASVRDAFDYVYVDEYQDINRMQHAILAACARADNRFMVGDVKQSIYAFRRAEPDIFADLRRSFPPLCEGDGAPAASLSLSDNFRSDGTVIGFVNAVFDRAFGAVGESIDYRPEDALVCGKNVPGDENPRLIFLRKPPKDAEEPEEPDAEKTAAPDPDGGEGSGGEDKADAAACEIEARYIAREIRRLLALTGADGRPRYRPGDCAVLLRSLKGRERTYLRALEDEGLEAEVSGDGGFLLRPEILLTMCLLNAVDNPLRDVWLAGLMNSPLYGFSPDDLTRIRLSGDRELTLWESVRACAAESDDQRIARLTGDLARFRDLAESLPIDRFLRRVYDETGLLALSGAADASGSGIGGRDSLLRLYHFARTFAAGENRGLHAFIGYVDRLSETKNAFAAPENANPDPRKVRLMTVHKSKGLEFPVVFLAGTGAPPNGGNRDDKGYLFDPKLGAVVALHDVTGRIAVKGPLWQIVKETRRDAEAEEELRVLYVALTRAKERLYVVASPYGNKKPESYEKDAALLRAAPLAYGFKDAPCFFTVVASAFDPAAVEYTEAQAPAAGTVPAPLLTPREDAALRAEMERRFGFVYPLAHLHRLPRTIAVSHLYPTVLDGTEDRIVLPQEYDETDRPVLPAFRRASRADTAAERGIATHLFLQFCDLGHLLENGVEAERRRLVEKRFLTEKQAADVREDELETFRRSPWPAEMLGAARLLREFRFHVRLPADAFSADPDLRRALSGETLLVQGVVDCLWENEAGELTLIDYKTDRLSPDELRDPALAARTLLARHAEQLHYYTQAMTRIFGKTPARIGIYSLHAGRAFWQTEESHAP